MICFVITQILKVFNGFCDDIHTSMFSLANLSLVPEFDMQCVLQALEYVFLAPYLLQVKACVRHFCQIFFFTK